MNKRLLCVVWIMVAWSMVAAGFCLTLPNRLLAAGVELATDAPRPITPEESIKQFQLAKGFRIELAASEPHLADPVAIAFDPRGRIFVCEIHGYNLEGYLDVLELNKTGVLDKAVRRIPANPDAIKQAEQQQYGTVKLLDDTDGDGRVDRATVWADRLPACYGVVPARDGVIVLCAPDIVYLGDPDGDGKPEVKETLFSGFGIYDLWSRINNPRWGPDNWIYGSPGIGSGGTIRGPKLTKEVQIGATCFRFKPDGTALEPCSGTTSGFGQAMTDFGDRFLVTNQQHALYVAPLPHRYLARNPYYASPSPVLNISSYGHPARVFPTSQPDPWRTARSKDPEWVKFYGVKEATASGYFTAASGQTIYRADAFGPEYYGNHFSVDNAQNLVHRCLLLRQGAGFTVKRPRPDEKVEFLTSTEQWFRPVNLVVGPDGAMYIVDMYRDIIEDYSAIPRYLQQLYIKSIIAGASRGRIWRVVAEGAPRPRRFDLRRASTAELVAELSNANAWWRQTAQRLLIRRADKTAVGPLEELVEHGKTPQARLHALYTLDGLAALRPDLVERALEDPHYGVRTHAVCLAEKWLDKQLAFIKTLIGMVDDPDPSVRLQLGFTLGESKDRQAVEALTRLAVRYGNDRWMQAAILSSVADSADKLLGVILHRSDDLGQSKHLLHPLASIVGARHNDMENDKEIGNLLVAVATIEGESGVPLQITCLKGLVEGLKQGKPHPLGSSDGRQRLCQLLVSGSSELRQLAFQVAGLVKLRNMPEMKTAFAEARETVLDGSRSTEDRRAALAVLIAAPYAELASTVEDLLGPQQPLQMQLAAVAALASADDPEVASDLLAGFAGYTPKVQAAVIDAVFSRRNRLPGLLDALEEGTLGPSSLDSIRREQLIASSDAEISRRAKSLLAGPVASKDRENVLAQYQVALSKARDVKHGKEVFDQQCAKCHKLQDQGYEVGPDLSAANSRPDETLVSDILDPNNQITTGYRNYTVITEDGRIFTGVLAAETATSVTLRKEESVEQTILRKDIDEMEASPNSMMPEELDKEVSPKDVADLIAYLREVLGPVPSVLSLFEDQTTFPAVLNEGKGTVRLDSGDRFSGKASLAVTPPQRWSLRIPGWQYRIKEKPGPGEYRYLRFAWKSRGGDGIMLELAGNGDWPPADRPLWRYYSGKNPTGWAAVRISSQPPNEWTVVTRDLWKDFGEFTLTGIAPTAIGGEALFDRIELLHSLGDEQPAR